MGITTRLVRIFKADLHGVMDQLEDQGLLLKQHLRDMQAALNNKEAKLKMMMTTRNQAQQELDRHRQQSEKLEQDLTVAIQKGKDDIARMLLKKVVPLNRLCAELASHVETLDDQITRFKAHLDQQRLQYEQLKCRCAEYFHRSEMQACERNTMGLDPLGLSPESSEEEIELELLRRKELIKGGAVR